MIENYLASFTEGRLRLRHSIFKDENIYAQVHGLLQNVSGVEFITHNIRTGSILIEYDAEVLDQESLFELLKQGEQMLALSEIKPAPKAQPCCITSCFSNLSTREKRRMYNRAMGLSLGVSIVGIGLGSERVHIFAGTAFLLLSLGHIKRMRKALI